LGVECLNQEKIESIFNAFLTPQFLDELETDMTVFKNIITKEETIP